MAQVRTARAQIFHRRLACSTRAALRCAAVSVSEMVRLTLSMPVCCSDEMAAISLTICVTCFTDVSMSSMASPARSTWRTPSATRWLDVSISS